MQIVLSRSECNYPEARVTLSNMISTDRLWPARCSPKIGATNSSIILFFLGLALLLPFHKAQALTRWQRQIKAMVRQDTIAKRKIKSKCRDLKFAASKKSFCDVDGDKFVNYREWHFPLLNKHKIKTNFKNADTDGDGVSDYDEILKYGTDPLVADSKGNGGGNCGPANFDSAGNTTQFGIPAGITGNVARGQAVNAAQCRQCHPANDHGINWSYDRVQAAITGTTGLPMRIQLATQDLSDLTAWLNRAQTGGNGECSGGTPTPTPPGGNTTPSPEPTATPPCVGGTPNFDSQGNTTAFGIPAPLVGNITAGQSQYTTTCATCHLPAGGVRGAGMDFGKLKTAFSTNLFMNGTYGGPVNLSDQQIANVVAYVRKNETVSCQPGSMPTPTPTPNPVSQGAAIFTASCVRCHRISSNGEVHDISRHPSLNKIHQALWSGPDEMPQFRNLVVGQSAPPYSDSENALWQYLGSLP